MIRWEKCPEDSIKSLVNFIPGQQHKELLIEEAAKVFLQYNGTWVIVRNIQKQREGHYTGEVMGFQPAASKVGDLSTGDAVDFIHSDVCCRASG